VFCVARQFRLRVRPGSFLRGWTPDGQTEIAYAGDEFTVPASEAATYLRGKGRRSFDIVEVFDDEDESGREQNGPRSG
jgi:hypothetical protein